MKSAGIKAIIALTALQLIIILLYVEPGVIFGEHPIMSIDYGKHYYNLNRWLELFSASGRTWGYDPYFMAGYPFGAYWSIGDEGTAVLVGLLSLFGLGIVKAFHIQLVLLFLLFVPAMYCAARLLKVDRLGASVAAGISVVAWLADPCLHWQWLSGMYTFFAASYLGALLLALFYDYLGTGRGKTFLYFSLLAIFVSVLHPVAGAALVFPSVAALVLFRKNLSGKTFLHFGLFVVFLVAVSIHWVKPLILFQDDFVSHAHILQASISDLVRDLFGGTNFVSGTGYASAFVLRRALYVLGIMGLVNLYRDGDRRLAWYLIVANASLFMLVYLGSYVSFFANVQPYRYMGPLLIFMIIPASVGLTRAAKWTWNAKILYKAPAIIAALIVAIGIGYDFKLMSPHLFGEHKEMFARAVRPSPARAEEHALVEWLKANTDKSARIFCDEWQFSLTVAMEADREVIGGPYFHMPMKQAYANLNGQEIFGRDLFSFSEQELRERLEAFNIKWMVVRYPDIQAFFATMPGLFQLKKAFYLEKGTVEILNRPGYIPKREMWGYAIYEANIEPTFFIKGSGKIKSSMNLIELENPSTGEIVLKYHWLKRLKSEPPLKLEPARILDDPVGFIRIHNDSNAPKIEIFVD